MSETEITLLGLLLFLVAFGGAFGGAWLGGRRGRPVIRWVDAPLSDEVVAAVDESVTESVATDPVVMIAAVESELARMDVAVTSSAASATVAEPAGPVLANGPCPHLFTGHPVEQDRNGFRIYRCTLCGDEQARAGLA